MEKQDSSPVQFPAVKMEDPVEDRPARPKKVRKAKSKAKAKSTARTTRAARQPKTPAVQGAPKTPAARGAPKTPQGMDMDIMLSKRPKHPKQAILAKEQPESTSPENDEAKQMILNMGEGGKMVMADPAKVDRKKLRGPAIGGDFGKARRGKMRIIARLKDFRSRAYMYRAIWQGRFKKSPGGLKKEDLKVGVTGRIVPRRLSSHCRKVATDNGWLEHWTKWLYAVKLARDSLGVEGFVKVKKNGTDEEMSLYGGVASHYAGLKSSQQAGGDEAEVAAGAAAVLVSAGA